MALSETPTARSEPSIETTELPFRASQRSFALRSATLAPCAQRWCRHWLIRAHRSARHAGRTFGDNAHEAAKALPGSVDAFAEQLPFSDKFLDAVMGTFTVHQ